MRIDILYTGDIDEETSWKKAFHNVGVAVDALDNIKVKTLTSVIPVKSDDEAIEKKFLGSPSIHVNGQELFPEERQNYHLGNRTYETEDGIADCPRIEMIRKKLLDFKLTD